MRLTDRHVLLCVGGGIAAYKAAELVRELDRAGAAVQVAMTRAATSFITPLTLQTLSRRPVATDLLDAGQESAIGHIRLAEQADVVLVAPATADLIARMAAGMADDIVTAALLVNRAPVVVAPSMNTNMLEHPAVQSNLRRLAEWGCRVVPSDEGELACGWTGVGRLPDAALLVEEVRAALSPKDLAGVRVLVSTGPTREALDPVRYLTNRSSGRMGMEVAAAALRRGAEVDLVCGPVSIPTPRAARVVRVESAAQMQRAVEDRVASSDVVVMVAAVADYRPAEVAAGKRKKEPGAPTSWTLELEQTTDILAGVAAAAGERIVVGFAAETRDVARYGRDKLVRKGLDLVVANDVSAEGAGFDVATNRALLIDADGGEEDSGLVGKDELAERIIDRIVELRRRRGRDGGHRDT